MIKKIKLYNYRSYSTFEKVFTDDLNIIQGRNATGKSTIVEALGYALQGSSLQKGKSASWIKQGEIDGKVILYIDDFIITRGNKKQVVTDLEGNIIARGHTGLNEWVDKEYGLLPELYKTSYHVAQKEISSFAALGPMEKTKRVEKLLKLDVIDSIKQNALDTRRGIIGSLTFIEDKCANLPNMDEADIPILEQTLIDIDNSLSELREKELEQVELKNIYQNALNLWNKKNTLLARLFYKGTADEVDKEITYLEEAIIYAKAEAANRKLYDEKCILGKQLAGIVINEKYFTSDIEQCMNLRTLVKKSNLAKEDLKKYNESFCPEKGVTQGSLDSLKNKQAVITSELAKLSKSPINCPTCGHKLKDMKPKIKSLEASLTDITFTYERDLNSFNYTNLMNHLYLGDETVEEIDIMIDSIKNKQKYERLESLKDIREPERSISVSNLETKLIDFKSDKAIHTRLEEYKDVVSPEPITLVSYDKHISKLQYTRQKKAMELENLKRNINSFKELKEDLEQKQLDKDQIDSFISFIAFYRASFSAKIIPMIEENANKIINYLSEGKLKSLNLDKNYIIQGYDMYSGSEEDAANFALRLAIAQIARIGKYNTIVLDEIASSYDSVREDRLIEVLKATDMQIIYISHGDIDN